MKCLLCNLICNSTKSLLSHVKYNHKLSTEEYYLLNHSKGICKTCGKETKFKNYHEGYRNFCSFKCAANNAETKSKRVNTCLDKYGCTNISQVDDIKDKKSQKYQLQADEIKEKVKQTNLARYGCEWYVQSDKFKQKAKQTCLEKYNKDNYAKTNRWKQQLTNTYNESINLYKKFGYVPTQELLLKYGSGWYQHKLVPMVKYKHKSYVEDKYLDQIEQYSKRTKSKLESYIYMKS